MLGGEPVPSEVGSYHGTTGFTTAPNSARSFGESRIAAGGDGSVTDRSAGSRGSSRAAAAAAAASASSDTRSQSDGAAARSASRGPDSLLGKETWGGGRLRLPKIFGLRS